MIVNCVMTAFQGPYRTGPAQDVDYGRIYAINILEQVLTSYIIETEQNYVDVTGHVTCRWC